MEFLAGCDGGKKWVFVASDRVFPAGRPAAGWRPVSSHEQRGPGPLLPKQTKDIHSDVDLQQHIRGR